MLLFQSDKLILATLLWLVKVVCVIFWFIFLDHFQPDSSVPFITKQFNNGLIVKYLVDFSHSLQFTGIWYFWALGHSPPERTQKCLALLLSLSSGPYTLVRQFCWWMQLSSERDHLFSAVFWIRVRMKVLGDRIELFWKFRIPPDHSWVWFFFFPMTTPGWVGWYTFWEAA